MGSWLLLLLVGLDHFYAMIRPVKRGAGAQKEVLLRYAAAHCARNRSIFSGYAEVAPQNSAVDYFCHSRQEPRKRRSKLRNLLNGPREASVLLFLHEVVIFCQFCRSGE